MTDFSLASEQALPFAMALARHYGGKIRALHVIAATRANCSNACTGDELVRTEMKAATTEMHRLDSEMYGTAHYAKLLVREEKGIWPAVEEVLSAYHGDLIVVGTHGRNGAAKNWFGSTAEEVFRRSTVPVLTVGPHVSCDIPGDDRFHRVLFATNFKPESNAALKYARAFADEDRAQLLMMHVVSLRDQQAGGPSVAETMHKLYELIPQAGEARFRSEGIVRFGEPSRWIVETAKDRCADLIVMGVCDHAADLKVATHFDMTTAYKVVASAPCPVLTVRSAVPAGEVNTPKKAPVN